ncbi:thermonuclease family protein [Falsiroseomonas sp. CW058]|uniref:thermonuclease family protein n=1 Tax=Falsiroseomonas sp. CW058 TaxID=3388664 RepID=UPI003D321571
MIVRRARRRLSAALLLLGLAVAGWLGWQGGLLPGPGGPDLQGQATVVDGDTLVVEGRRVRLEGIDAPEARQTCLRNGAPWPCGAEATRALRDLLEAGSIACVASGEDRYRRVLARCHLGGTDIAAWLVREGWAVAYTRYSWRYMRQEVGARWAGRGIWSGSFETPEDWRRHAR